MDRYRKHSAPRRRRGPATGRRRRGRIIAPTHPRLWWCLAAGLLLSLLLFPLHARAQGLRSTTASVSIVAIKRDPLTEAVRDFNVARTWQGAPVAVSVRLASGSDSLPLFVRDSTGRFARVTAEFVPVEPNTLRFRAVAPEPQGLGNASWQLEIRSIDAAGRATLSATRIVNR